jgi:hypothetical protein
VIPAYNEEDRIKTLNFMAILMALYTSFLVLLPVPAVAQELSSVSKISWNGDYWLVSGDYKLLKYDGERFTDIKNLTPGFMRLGRGSEAVSVREMAWNGEYWLMSAGLNRLVKFDGRVFTDLTEEADLSGGINAIAWGGEYWLIGSNPAKGGGGILVKYDGERFEDLTAAIRCPSSDDPGRCIITSISYGGNRWLIGSFRGLTSFNGTASVVQEFQGQIIREIVFNSRYWLIVSDAGIFKYDGRVAEDLSQSFKYEAYEHVVDFLEWNGRYFLVGISDSGANISRKIEEVNRGTYLPQRIYAYTSEEPQSLDDLARAIGPVKAASWGEGERHWLLGGYRGIYLFNETHIRDLGALAGIKKETRVISALKGPGHWLVEAVVNDRRGLFRYDGRKLARIPAYVGSPVLWNEELGYWVFLAAPPDRVALIKYDGRSFSLLSEFHSYCAGGVYWNGESYLAGVCGSAMRGLTGYMVIHPNGSVLDYIPYSRTPTWRGQTWNLSVADEEVPVEILVELRRHAEGSRMGDAYRIYDVPLSVSRSCSGEYCLVYGKGYLAREDGWGREDLTSMAGLSPEEEVVAAAWSGEYWLLSVSNWAPGTPRPLWKTYTSRLLKYDGETFTGLSEAAELSKTHIRGVGPKVVSIIECIEDYCLLGYWIPYPGGNGGLMRYDGGLSFKDLSRKGEVRDMAWNGREWLVHYKTGESHSSIIEIYDGKRSRDLSRLFALPRRDYWVRSYAWLPDERKWVIEAVVGEQLEEVVVTYPPEGVGRFLVCGPTFLLLVAMLPAVTRWRLRGK